MTIAFKTGHNGSRHVDETQLNQEEAALFVAFLEAEVQRHKDAILMCDYLCRFFHLAPVLVVAYDSSILGHREDITATKITIEYLKNKWVI